MPAINTPKKSSIALVERRLKESGMHWREFAAKVVIRDERTLRRWLDGESPVPQVVLDFLQDWRAAK